ncbi:tumor necrosis factor alpha-induced protein 8-like protein [Pollicipes pollicipes]|uniref:tumor necrosis factor alpha-induced protein 8-like protein n=1 Tax=Pollicipes pollicipes TaxID=41117 RepID=UPI001884D0FE|nr:tumor necrosis factor alpha-induced protein 8-like protein [Pollicipes pollicipes]
MSEFRAKDIGLRVQKKLASKISNKTVARTLLDDATSQILDNLFKLCKGVTGNKKESEKVIKNLIKVVVKVGILNKNDQFDHDEMVLAAKFQRKFQMTSMTIISFYQIDFSYDRSFITQSLLDMKAMLTKLVERHLTDKTLSRIEHVFTFFREPRFLDAVFARNSEHRDLLGKITKDLNTILEASEDDAS